MEKVKSKSFDELNTLVGKTVNFTSSCEFFPNFNVVGRVMSVRMNSGEITFDVMCLPNNRRIDIGSNMANLAYKIV